MNVFVFKPTNQPIGKFEVQSLEIADLEAGLSRLAESHRVRRYDYLESEGRTWTVMDDQDGNGIRIEESRFYPERLDSEAVSIENRASMLERRYAQRYQRADFVIKVGSVVKVLAVLFAIGAFFLVFLKTVQAVGGMALVQAVWTAISVGAPIFLAGVVVGVLGDILQSNLDIGVHGSPYLDDEQRARVMNVPRVE